MHQHFLGSVFSSIWSAPDHLVRTSVQLFDEAIAIFLSHVFDSVSHVVSHSRDTTACLSFVCVQDSPAYAEATGACLSSLGPEIQALWPKPPMHAAIGHQHRGGTLAQRQPSLSKWGLAPEAQVAAARLLKHPFAEAPQTELGLSFAVGA